MTFPLGSASLINTQKSQKQRHPGKEDTQVFSCGIEQQVTAQMEEAAMTASTYMNIL